MDPELFIENKDLPAYPVSLDGHHLDDGLTKREVFAMAAMQGLVKDIVWQDSITGEIQGVDYVAKVAIKIADELLKQLEK